MMWARFSAALIVMALAPAAASQDYPAKPVRFVVGFTAGGATDVAARIVAQRLTESLGRTFVVDNRPGASGMIGAELVAKSPPDGYTLLVAPQTSQAVAPSLYPKIPYDPVRDFAPITVIASSPLLLAVHPSVPVKTMKELIALAKAQPGQLTFGSGGAGTAPHMTGELVNLLMGVKMVHVPYKGEAPGVRDLLAGQITLMFSTLPPLLPHVQAGKLRGIAVTSLKRPSTVPDIPTVAESGYSGFDVAAWFGLFAPAGTPREIVNKLHAEVVRVISQPDVREKIAVQGLFVVANTPDEFAAFLKAEIARWAKVVKESGAKSE